MKRNRRIEEIDENKIKPWKVRDNPFIKSDIDFFCELSVLKDSGQIIKEFETGKNQIKNPLLEICVEYMTKIFLYGDDFDRVENIVSFWDKWKFWEYKIRYDMISYRVIIYDDSEKPSEFIPIVLSGSATPAMVATINGVSSSGTGTSFVVTSSWSPP